MRPTLEPLEQRLAPEAGTGPGLFQPPPGYTPAAPVVSFSADQSTVSVQTDGHLLTIPRPVVSPWDYQASGTTYWVAPGGNDGNAGGADDPFATIGRAVAAAGPGDLIYVRAGTYNEAVTFTKSGEPGEPIILSCAPGDLGRVTITPPADYVQQNPDGAVVTLDGADYVWINGLVIEGPKGRPEAPVAEHYGANGITFENAAGLGDEATNNVVFNNVHCGIKEMHHGGVGILLQGNVIFDNGTTSLDHGIYMPADDVTMDGNIVFNNTGFGIHSYPAPTGQVITHNVLFGNLMAGIILAGSGNTVEWNTSVYNGIGIFYFRGGCTDNVVEHNVFAYNSTDGGYDNGGGTLGDPSNNTDDYNVYGTAPDPRIIPGPHESVGQPQFLSAPSADFRLADTSARVGAYAAPEVPGGGNQPPPPVSTVTDHVFTAGGPSPIVVLEQYAEQLFAERIQWFIDLENTLLGIFSNWENAVFRDLSQFTSAGAGGG